MSELATRSKKVSVPLGGGPTPWVGVIVCLLLLFGCPQNEHAFFGSWSDGKMTIHIGSKSGWEGVIVDGGSGHLERRMHGTWSYATNGQIELIGESYRVHEESKGTEEVRLTAKRDGRTLLIGGTAFRRID